ncbi:hypothetical protein ACAX43_22605 [Paraburkholderia sp. IW21]|uniref:hypothetical protein n=1 Tax=Paraburkholderia sp. IW21 TaxID=3242488 RepID=UPI00352005AB
MSSVIAGPSTLPDYPLNDWVKQFPPQGKSLRWVHTTNALALRTILKSGVLSPQQCPVFKAPLTYMFYGRPAYRFKGHVYMQQSFASPVVLVFKEEVLALSSRLFPFDTGAFDGGRYKKWLDEQMKLDSFEYPTNNDMQGRHVTAFYGENSNYWHGDGIEIKGIAGEFEVEVVKSMIQAAPSEGDADDRRLSIELIIKDEIPMTSDYVEAMLIPTTLADADFVRKFKNEVGLHVMQYRASKNKPAIEYQALLEFKIEEYHALVGAL